MVAWFGITFATTLLAGVAVVLLTRQLATGPLPLPWLLLEMVYLVVEPLAAWWLYHNAGRGARMLSGPRSATLFVFLVAGLVAFFSASARWLAAWQWLGIQESSPVFPLIQFWLERALSYIVVAPPILVMFTSLLVRKNWIAAESTIRDEEEPTRFVSQASPWSLPDLLETLFLALGSAALCLMLSWIPRNRESFGWQLWGIQLLFVVWASIRQGLRGGLIVASTSAAVPLLSQQWNLRTGDSPVLLAYLQAHLYAQAAMALLVASAASWVRNHETGYRQIASHLPVVIYSARLGGNGAVPEITLVSSASEAILGHPPDQLLGDYSRWLNCVLPDDREVLRAAVDQLGRQTQPVLCEYRVYGEASSSWRTGESGAQRFKVRWVRDTLAPIRDSEGNLLGWEGVVTDITEQRKIADDLRRTTSMFNALLENLPAGVFFVSGPHGMPVLVNPRARQLLGQREDASVRLEQFAQHYRLFRNDGTIYPTEELPVYLALKQGLSTMREDMVIHRTDGRRIPLVAWSAPVQLHSREHPDAAVWVFEDLTAVHQAEAARKDSEGRFRAVIETMAEGLLVLDNQGRVVASNPAAVLMYGIAAEQMRGRQLFELDWNYLREDGSSLPKSDHPVAVVRRSGRPVRNVVLGGYPSGVTSNPHDASLARWMLCNAMPLGSAGVVLTFSDISTYIQAREAIRVSEERFRGLVEALPLMVLLTDRQMSIQYINPASVAIAGYTLNEIQDPSSWTMLIHPKDLPAVLELYSETWMGKSGRTEIRFRAKNGQEKSAIMLIQPRWHGDGVILGAMVLLLDVSRERQLEAELQRAQRLEIVGRLASGVAHDFNNWLAVVLNLTDLVRTHLSDNHPAVADLKKISEAGEQAAGLAGQLLSLSRQRSAPTEAVDLNLMVRNTLELLRSSMPITILVETDLHMSPMLIQAEVMQIQQVLMNLCLNACDAMPEGGVLRLATRALPDTIELVVQDTGDGMSPEVRQRIFEPFFTTKATGNGLGLAIVQQIVEGFGGTIEVESQPSKGTRFVLRWVPAK
jgi:PAS domain S-box-containing protein